MVFFKYSKWPVAVQTRYAKTKKDIKYAIMYCAHCTRNIENDSELNFADDISSP